MIPFHITSSFVTNDTDHKEWGFMPECREKTWCTIRAAFVLTCGPIICALYILQLISDWQYARQASQYTHPYYEIGSRRGMIRPPSSRRPLMKLLVHRVLGAASVSFTIGWWLQVPEVKALEIMILSATAIDMCTSLLLIIVLILAFLVLKALFSSNRVIVPGYAVRVFYLMAGFLVVACLFSNLLCYLTGKMWPRGIWFISVAVGTWICLGVFFRLAFRLKAVINAAPLRLSATDGNPPPQDSVRTSELARSVLARFLRLMVISAVIGSFATTFQIADAVLLFKDTERPVDLDKRTDVDNFFSIIFATCQLLGMMVGLWWGWVPIYVPEWCCCNTPRASYLLPDSHESGGVDEEDLDGEDVSYYPMED